MGTTTIKAITRNNLKPNGSYGVIITHITYDDFNNPVRIQFDNGNVTKYVYSATGQKLRTIHYTAVENTHVSMGCDLEDIEDIYLAVDSTDYLLGGSVIYVNEQLSKILFDGGYVDASYAGGPHLSYKYYNRDHLGNNREVVDESGAVLQRTDYYPFGTPFSSPSSTINAGLQPFKYNNKELDMMHGLNTYDYGARQYYPLLPMWDRVDPLAEDNPGVSPYMYCAGDPVNKFDPDGRNPIYDTRGVFLGCTSEGYTGQIYIYKGAEQYDFNNQDIETLLKNDDLGNFMTFEAVEESFTGDAKANFVSNIMTNIVEHAEGRHIFEYSFQTSTLHERKIGFSMNSKSHFTTEKRKGEEQIRIEAHENIGKDYEATVENLSSTIITHEWYSHGIKGYGDRHHNHRLAYRNVMNDKVYYPRTTKKYKKFVNKQYKMYKSKEKNK
jgi:RHS repeat-associated protein